jgi:hypothetical protein
MYRFRVYRNPNTPSISGNFSDVVRYYFSLYNHERDISPLWNNLSFSWEREKERMFFRKKLKGELILVGDDYSWALEIKNDGDERAKYRVVVIDEKVDGVWEEVWKGFFSISAGNFDLDKCIVKFEDLLVWDKYNVILENAEREKNLIDIPTYTVWYKKEPYDYDVEIIKETTTFGLANGCSLPPDHFFEPQDGEIEYGTKYILYSKRVDYIGTTINNGNHVHQYSKTFEYRRDYLDQVADPGGNWVKSSPDPIPGTNGVYHWVRQYLDNDSPTFTTNYYRVYYPTYACFLRRAVSLSDITEVTDVENTRGRYLGGAILYLLEGLPMVKLTYAKSKFLQDTTNPITGTANRLSSLFIFQLTDLKETSDPATKAVYTLKDVENWLKLFQAYWYIDDDGVLVIEHKKFFDLGLSYDDYSVGLDVTANKEAKATSKFSYIKQAIHRMDKLVVGYNSADDFVGEPILYHGNMVNWGDGATMTYSANKLSTDLQYILNNEDSVGDDGFVLLACFPNEVMNRFEVYRGNGSLTTQLVWNAPLAVANIQNDYWKWGRPIEKGVMNNTFTEFESVEPSFAQEEFTVAWCDDFNPYKRVRTEYGLGRVESASCTLKDKKLTLSLYY